VCGGRGEGRPAQGPTEFKEPERPRARRERADERQQSEIDTGKWTWGTGEGGAEPLHWDNRQGVGRRTDRLGHRAPVFTSVPGVWGNSSYWSLLL
jgi:hypothetical protein